jgi:preprotein translocase subunit YajC
MFNHVLNFFITTANAADSITTAETTGSGISMMVMVGLSFLFLYFMAWRPQQKRVREQQAILTSLGIGDEVLTSGGILGRIVKLEDQYLTLAIANNVEILLQRSSVVNVLPKGTLKSIT